MNSNFRRLVARSRELGRDVIDRCNLTVLFEPGLETMPDFLAAHQVEITASLPCYTAGNVDAQRGRGVFDKSIRALQKLNELGYGLPGSALKLILFTTHLAQLAPRSEPFGGRLQTSTARSLLNRVPSLVYAHKHANQTLRHFLDRSGKRTDYMALLVNHFNPDTVPGLMCRSLINVGWDGALYDCDFNQMLEIGMDRPLTVWDLETFTELDGQNIATAVHCFGCTAGAGSSCGGALK